MYVVFTLQKCFVVPITICGSTLLHFRRDYTAGGGTELALLENQAQYAQVYVDCLNACHVTAF